MDSKTTQIVEDAKDAVAKIIIEPDLTEEERELANEAFDILCKMLGADNTGAPLGEEVQ